jgi:hypothetical protein
VITADNLLIEECRLQNTRGTAPEAGIDFEPNHPEEVLSNCVLRNVRSDNNAGHAYHFYLGNLAERSQPISIRLENCSSSGCDRHSASIAIDNRNGERSVRGSIEFVNCRFDNDRGGGIQIRGNEGDGCRMRFVECTVIRQDVNDLSTAPITILAPRRPDLTTGNIELARCVVRDALDRRPISLSASPLIGLENLSGSLDVVSPAGERSYTLDAAQLQQWFPDQGRIARVPRWDFDWRTCQSVTAGGVSFVDGRGSVRLRQRASLIVWAEAHQPLKLEVIMEPVGRYTAGPGQLQLTAPTGEPQRLPPQVAAGRVAYEFTPRQDGPHRLDWTGSSHETLRPVRCSRPLAILSELSGTSLIHPVGTLQFRVPAAVTRWAIVVGGAGPGERVTATIRDAAGNTVASQENIAATHLFMLQRQPSTDDQIWSITFARPSEGVLEDVSLYCVGIPPLLSISAGQ